jgi:hypothetical protein
VAIEETQKGVCRLYAVGGMYTDVVGEYDALEDRIKKAAFQSLIEFEQHKP